MLATKILKANHVACAMLVAGLNVLTPGVYALAPESGATISSAAASQCAQSNTPPKKKRKGIGLGGLLGAAQQAGVGRLLGGGMLGSGGGEQIAGAVLGTAVEAAGRESSKEMTEQAATAEASAHGSGSGCRAEQAAVGADNRTSGK